MQPSHCHLTTLGRLFAHISPNYNTMVDLGIVTIGLFHFKAGCHPECPNLGLVLCFFEYLCQNRCKRICQEFCCGSRKDAARPLVRVSALYSIQCFDTDGWMTGRTSILWRKTHSTNPYRFCFGTGGAGGPQDPGGTSWLRFTWKNGC